VFEEFRVTVAEQTLSRELRVMGYRKLSARPRHHAQAEGAIEDFKKSFPAIWPMCASSANQISIAGGSRFFARAISSRGAPLNCL
jgi:hypothetical protein